VPVPEAKTTKNRLHLDFRPDDRTLRYSDYLPWAPREQTWDRASGRGWSSQTPKATSSAYLGHAPPSRQRGLGVGAEWVHHGGGGGGQRAGGCPSQV
jgi:hypothetical protein